jgi:DNA-binding MarR family transcriptional regulator
MNGDDRRLAAGEVWRALVDLWTQRNRWVWVANELGISPGHGKALISLSIESPPPMRVLADELHCDASFVTSIVDKLEERGFVERRPSPTDRRVKTVVITEAGLKARDRLEAAMYEPPPELLELPDADIRALRRIVAKLPAAHSWHGQCGATSADGAAPGSTKSA